MRVLVHGMPFFCSPDTLKAYSGKHEIRTILAREGADYQYRPDQETFDDILKRLGNSWQPDLILVWTPENDPPPLGIEDVAVRTAATAGDWNLFYGAQRYNIGRYDVVVGDKSAGPILTSEFGAPSYAYPLYAHNPSIHTVHPVSRDIDVLYVGSLNSSQYPKRAQYMERLLFLAERFKVVVKIGVYNEEYAQLLSRARLVFNHSVRGEANLRIFETMACGAGALLEEDNLEVRDYFEDGRDIILYNDRNFEDKIIHFLTYSQELEAIARRGRERVQTLSGMHRFDALIDHVMAQPDSGRPFHRLSECDRAIQTYLMYTTAQHTQYEPLERRLVDDLTRTYPEDSRSWAACVRTQVEWRASTPSQEQGKQILDACKKALALAPDNAVYLFNGATVSRVLNNADFERRFLELTLRATSIEHPEFLIREWQNWFWNLWVLEMAKHSLSPEKIHAEAHIRLARLLERQGEHSQAVRQLDEAARLAPENAERYKVYVLATDAGDIEPCALPLFEGRRNYPLSSDYRHASARYYFNHGHMEMSSVLWREARLIEQVLQAPSTESVVPSPVETNRDLAVQHYQKRELALLAEKTGIHRDLFVYLAVNGEMDELEACAASAQDMDDQDQIYHTLLTLDHQPDRADQLVARLPELRDSWAYYTLAKFFLHQGQVADALRVVVASMQHDKHDLATLNLVMKFASREGDTALMKRLSRTSLTTSPCQAGVSTLSEFRYVWPLYLGVVPQRLSVGYYLPAYNVERYIRTSLKMVFRQSYPLEQVLVVDDATPDRSMEIAREFPVTVVTHKENRGLAAARNSAFAAATTQWVGTVDTDACLDSDYTLKALMEIENAEPHIVGVGGSMSELRQTSGADRWRALAMRQNHGPVRQEPPVFLYGANSIWHRDTVLSIGGYDEKHRTNAEDTNLAQRIHMAGYSFVYTPYARVGHMRGDDNQSLLRTWWGWHYWNKVWANTFNTHDGHLHSMLHTLRSAEYLVHHNEQAGAADLAYISFLLIFHDALQDICHRMEIGQDDIHTVSDITVELFTRLFSLDARFRGDLGLLVRSDISHLLDLVPMADVPNRKPAPVYDPFFETLDSVLASIDANLYALLCEGARLSRVPKEWQEGEPLWVELAQFTGLPLQEVRARMAEPTRRTRAMRNMTSDQLGKWHRETDAYLFKLVPDEENLRHQQLARAIAQSGHKTSLRVLEYGSGIGSFALKLAGLGLQVVACEVNDHNAEFIRFRIAQRAWHDRITLLTPEESLAPDRKYHIISSAHVLEHMPTPFEVLPHLASCLVPGGLLLAVVPLDLVGADSPELAPGDTGSRLREMCADAGLSVEDISPFNHHPSERSLFLVRAIKR